MKKLLLLSVFSYSLMVGCESNDAGGTDSVGGSNGTDARTNSVSGYCGFKVVSDYNKVVLSCRHMTSDKDIDSCKSKAQSFLDKYPNINCQAGKPNDASVDPDTVTITSDEFKEIINKLENTG